jgi:hypothetical protein
MGIRFSATGIAIGVLLVLMLGRPAKADSFQVTGHTDSAACATVSFCSDISYSLDLTTSSPWLDPNSFSLQIVYLFISDISGQINGTSVFCTSPSRFGCGDLIASKVNYSGPPMPDQAVSLFASGSTVSLYGWPGAPSSSVRMSIDNHVAYVTWNIVSTPEPSTLLFLSIGLLGLVGLTLLKNRLS